MAYTSFAAVTCLNPLWQVMFFSARVSIRPHLCYVGKWNSNYISKVRPAVICSPKAELSSKQINLETGDNIFQVFLLVVFIAFSIKQTCFSLKRYSVAFKFTQGWANITHINIISKLSSLQQKYCIRNQFLCI